MAVLEHHAKGKALYEQGDFNGAVEAFREAAHEAPDSSTEWRLLAFMLLAAKRPMEALEVARHATELNPQDADAHLAVAQSYSMIAMFPQAVTELDKCLALRPNHPAARHLLVHALVEAAVNHAGDDPRVADDMLLRAHRMDVNSVEVAVSYLQFLIDGQERERAVKLYKELPEMVRHHMRIATLRQRMERDPIMRGFLLA